MGTLAAGVAHEVNNPLASISSLIQMIRSGDGIQPETREKLNVISTQIDRITQVTSAMTNFARVRPSARVAVEINDVVESSLRLASFDTTFRDLTIKKGLSNNLASIIADPDQLQQVVLNLLLNARDAMPDGGELTVLTGVKNGEAVISVADHGSGIDPDAAELVFDPFYTTKPAGKGTGLGLAVCYGVITAHGGRIELADNEPSGTIVSIFLPVKNEDPD